MAETETFFYDVIDTPIDKLAIVADEKGAMRMLSFDGDGERWRRDFARRFPGATLVQRHNPFGHATALKAYFAGDMEALDRIPVVFGGTAFHRLVQTRGGLRIAWKRVGETLQPRTTIAHAQHEPVFVRLDAHFHQSRRVTHGIREDFPDDQLRVEEAVGLGGDAT